MSNTQCGRGCGQTGTQTVAGGSGNQADPEGQFGKNNEVTNVRIL